MALTQNLCCSLSALYTAEDTLRLLCWEGQFFCKGPRGPLVPGTCVRGPLLNRIPNLRTYDLSSPNGDVPLATNLVAVWQTRGPFFDLLTPKGGRRVTKLFHPLEGTVTIRKCRTRVNRSLLSCVHEHTMVNAFKKVEMWDFP